MLLTCWLTRYVGLEKQSLAEMVAQGARPLGKQEATGVFRSKDSPARLSLGEFETGCIDYMLNLRNQRPPCMKQAAKVFSLSEEEKEGGLLDGWFTWDQMHQKYGMGEWRALPRHAIQQGPKWRLIDNGKIGQHNLTYEAAETIHTTCTAAGVAAAQAFRKLAKKPLKEKNTWVI